MKASSGRPAISPQTDTGVPLWAQASRMSRRTRRNGGDKGSYRSDTLGLPRSAANRYCRRSLVPTETKSASGNRASRWKTIAGASIIQRHTPAGEGAARPRRIAQATSRSTSARAARNSSTLVTRGNITRSGLPLVAAIRARSCRRSSAGRSRPILTARQPRAGLSSRSACRYGSTLSPPRSNAASGRSRRAPRRLPAHANRGRLEPRTAEGPLRP